MMKRVIALFLIAILAACNSGGLGRSDGVFAPGVAGKSDIDGLIVGHRLMAASEFELALKAYTRAAAQQGLNVDTLSALGSANLRLGRLGQAEKLLRRATEEDPSFPPAWNNLGVILMEKGNVAEASEVFRRAFAADNGNSDEIRDNLRLALANLENSSDNVREENQNFNLIRRGSGDFVLMSAL
ncbi:tetratricopeptide repeat protein [Yoonia sediminilitoris]|uniref:Tetratricopeptide repeat protein n=1 Tax=Yoonia sediminilitoris TaxID=1286148 RepID=A0A2T6KK33_9RHOB|nr:tetratricopeptide repeat protein [Yoonia sediminilitoris]PUB16323.1 tetratricopeptide repeat protein [Yoonia sediminilitoris]RCW96672.1 tetratricopeptide repeat protein [Yoonia sediminilitoris]